MKCISSLTLCAAVLLVLPLTACGSKEQARESYSANISPYNHTGDHIESYVDNTFSGHSSAYGGVEASCAAFPIQPNGVLTSPPR